jgi:hypothetical protein
MKYLSHYIEEAQTKAFKDNRTFFAFNKEQFEKGATIGIKKYTNMGLGMYCPSINAETVNKELKDIVTAGIKADIKDNGIKAIIHRELGNYECQITMDISDAVSALSGYPITQEDIQKEYKEFFQNCIDNDYF